MATAARSSANLVPGSIPTTGFTALKSISLLKVDPKWQFYAAGNFNSDDIMETIWKQPNGGLILWLMDTIGTTPNVIANAGMAPVGFFPILP